MGNKLKTQVGIIGAGPAGLLLGQMLYNYGIDSIIIERESRDGILNRIRAGVQESRAAETFIEHGVGERLKTDQIIHKGIHFNFDGRSEYIDVEKLTGNIVTVYGQRWISKDMIEIREANKLPLFFEAEASKIEDVESDRPKIHFTHNGVEKIIECDFVTGCDSYFGVGRKTIPQKLQKNIEYLYPYGWLAILAEAPPAVHEVIYAHHKNGFALQSMRSPELSRLYIQCDPNEDVNKWTDEMLWDELDLRIGQEMNRGKIIGKNVTGMRNYIAETMSYGRLFLAGDAAHIVPPTGAKGMNLAVGDVRVLSHGLKQFYKENKSEVLDNYSKICLDRIWKVERFSWWLTTTFHRKPNDTEFDMQMQIATLNYLTSSKIGAHSFAENYVGLPYTY